MTDQTFAQRLKARREHLGLTQAAVAAYMGVLVQTYQKWEYGTRRRPRYENMVMLAAALRCEVGDLCPVEKKQ
jgi:transcriptional regulator with XRE-family HTH domain